MECFFAKTVGEIEPLWQAALLKNVVDNDNQLGLEGKKIGALLSIDTQMVNNILLIWSTHMVDKFFLLWSKIEDGRQIFTLIVNTYMVDNFLLFWSTLKWSTQTYDRQTFTLTVNTHKIIKLL